MLDDDGCPGRPEDNNDIACILPIGFVMLLRPFQPRAATSFVRSLTFTFWQPLVMWYLCATQPKAMVVMATESYVC